MLDISILSIDLTQISVQSLIAPLMVLTAGFLLFAGIWHILKNPPCP